MAIFSNQSPKCFLGILLLILPQLVLANPATQKKHKSEHSAVSETSASKEKNKDDHSVASSSTSTPSSTSVSSTTSNAASPAEKNKAESTAFWEANRKKSGIVTLPSGLQYEVHKEGSGKSPLDTDLVSVHYRGKLLNGQEFDSSKANNPATFAVNAVIPGWTQALKLMKPGAKWTLYVPPQLAYGEKGVGTLIPPNSLLIFDVELASVKNSPDTDRDGVVENEEGLD